MADPGNMADPLLGRSWYLRSLGAWHSIRLKTWLIFGCGKTAVFDPSKNNGRLRGCRAVHTCLTACHDSEYCRGVEPKR